MELVDRVIKKYAVGNIVANREEFRRIFDDMRKSAGLFTPTPTWLLCKHPEEIETRDLAEIIELANSDELFQNEFFDLEQRMHGWVGGVHAKGIDDPSVHALVEKYASFLNRRDPLGLWKANVDDPLMAPELSIADLGSLMDLTLIHTYAFDPARKTTTMLEVGGGYGRLAEAALNIFGKSIRYVLIDSVPVSLYYSKKYLEKACPNVRIGSYCDGDPFDMTQFNCYILPAWYFEELNKEKYDVCINIESFQEMNQQHVDTYLQIFDRVSAAGATIYLDNAKDYIFRGEWNYPSHWQKLFGSNTPRSWSADHPAEVFVKSKGDFSSPNAMLDDLHYFTQEQLSDQKQLNAATPTLGDQIENFAGKRVRAVFSAGGSHLKALATSLERRKKGR
ncbi:MAG: putative sugar O-methyltransferase [Acidobacteriota bacterium]